MSLHYELTDETKTLETGTIVHRIRATRDLLYHGVMAGDLGGWIESTDNLMGEAWVADEAVVYDKACVFGRASVSGHACVCDEAWVYDQAWVSDNALIFVEAQVYGRANVHGRARVFDAALVTGEALVYGNASIFGMAQVRGRAHVYGNAEVCGNAEISGVSYDSTHVSGDAKIQHRAEVTRTTHYATYTIHTSQTLYFTLFRNGETGHRIIAECWSGTVDELENLIEQDKWVETRGDAVLEARPEMRAMCQLFRERIARW